MSHGLRIIEAMLGVDKVAEAVRADPYGGLGPPVPHPFIWVDFRGWWLVDGEQRIKLETTPPLPCVCAANVMGRDHHPTCPEHPDAELTRQLKDAFAPC